MFLRDSQVSWTSKLLSGWHPPSKTPTLGIEGILKGLMTFWRDKSLNNKSCSYYFVLFQSSKINLFRCESGRSKSYICLKWPLVFPFMHIVKPESKVPKSRPKGLGLTLKSRGPPPHHTTTPNLLRMMFLIHPAKNFDLLVLNIPVLSWIKPNQGRNTSPWAWHCWTPGPV